ncbi:MULTISPECIES: immunity 49 family protein [unclassified Kitasatospora]|uniref:immunity 49 family protein n=1 Tax=unclassified Kitasatospora TaxID=2633591 RepID=UPI000AA3E890|nr:MULTISPECIES: immunity 49 family protein [unclassified Kitasatospora]
MSSTVENFAERVGGEVHRMQNDESPAWGWEMVAESFLDYLGARSVGNPELAGKDARIACESAAAAAVGALALSAGRAGHPHVFIEYTGTGVPYGDGRKSEDLGGVAAHSWLDPFFLAFVAELSDEYGELFVAAAPRLRGQEQRADVVLVHALLAYVYGEAEQAEGLSAGGQVAVIDALVEGLGEGTDQPGHRAALATLRAVAAGDRAGFHRALAGQLAWYRQRYAVPVDGDPAPRTLLPFDAIALAAMAERWNGWPVAVESGYLPAALVGGFRSAGPRVLGFGREKQVEAVAALAAGPVVVDRPAHPYAEEAGRLVHEAYAQRELAKFRDPEQKPLHVMRALTGLMRGQVLRFLEQSALDPSGRDPRLWEALRIGAEAGGAAFRLARGVPGTEYEVTVAGTTRPLPACTGSYGPGAGHWKQAVALALVTGDRQQLADCVLVTPEFFTVGCYFGPVDAYGAALHDYLRGVDPVPAVTKAFTVCAQHERGLYLAPPVMLLSQLVEGDREGFALALADALEAHREHYTVGELPVEPDALVDLDILALACHAHRMGWPVPVRSPYLPEGLFGRPVRSRATCDV